RLASILTALSIRVPAGMFFVPGPGGRDNVFQFRIFGFPAEFARGLLSGGHQFGGSARTARLFDRWNPLTGNFFAGAKHFAHGVSVAIAEVIKSLLAGGWGEDMSLGEVNDVDVVADAGSIRGRIIGAENLAMRRLA